MELVRAAALKGYFEVAEELRLDPLPLLRRVGLTRSMAQNLEQMLPARSVIRLLEESANTVQQVVIDPTLVIRESSVRGASSADVHYQAAVQTEWPPE